MKKLFYLFCLICPIKSIRKRAKKFQRLKEYSIFLVEDGVQVPLDFHNIAKIENVNLRIDGSSDASNRLIIYLPQTKPLNVKILYKKANNEVIFNENVHGGLWDITLTGENNKCHIGALTRTNGPCTIKLIGNTLIIGRDCMFSNNIYIWGDGHSILDYETKQVLNKPAKPILIGDHCWIGERVSLNKNAQIPNDTVVAMAAVVTKPFDTEHSILAGVPAKMVKQGVTWHSSSPLTYKKK